MLFARTWCYAAGADVIGRPGSAQQVGPLSFIMPMRNILGPFASAMTGAIAGIFVAVFLFGIRDKFFLNGFAIVGAILGAAPEVIRITMGFLNDVRRLQAVFSATKDDTQSATKNSLLEQERSASAQAEKEARRKLLAAEHEARRPICSHCGKKTAPVFRHRKINGGPDMRYHDNPVLCNQCFKPYAGVRPWNLPNAGTQDGHSE
jgi:hypothetical protein